MGRLLLLSNGHGEDLSGALLGQALQCEGHSVDALPLVGKGQPYRDAGIALIGGTQEFSTGGLGYTSLRGQQFLRSSLSAVSWHVSNPRRQDRAGWPL